MSPGLVPPPRQQASSRQGPGPAVSGTLLLQGVPCSRGGRGTTGHPLGAEDPTNRCFSSSLPNGCVSSTALGLGAPLPREGSVHVGNEKTWAEGPRAQEGGRSGKSEGGVASRCGSGEAAVQRVGAAGRRVRQGAGRAQGASCRASGSQSTPAPGDQAAGAPARRVPALPKKTESISTRGFGGGSQVTRRPTPGPGRRQVPRALWLQHRPAGRGGGPAGEGPGALAT